MSNKTFMMIKPDAVERGLIGKILNDISSERGKIRNLTSGLAIIKKKNESYIGVADSRRDGSVRGK